MSQTPLRILVVLPMYGGSLPVGRYCARALADLGHTVQCFEAPLFHSAFTGLRELALGSTQVAQLEHSFLQVIAQAVWAKIQSLEPQLVLAMAQAPLSRSLLQRLRRSHVRTAMWFVEDWQVFNYWRDYAPLYDTFAVIQKEPFLSALRDAGQPHALYLPLAALPEFHRPLDLSPSERKEYGSEIAFLGAGYPNRRQAFRRLVGRNFKIWGSDWEGESLLSAHIQRQGIRISEEESVKIYNAASINLNLHSSIRGDTILSHGDFVNPRTFELAAVGAFQLVDKRDLMPELFASDELATFETSEEFFAAIDYYLAHPEERTAIAAKARERVLREHTYVKRMTSLLDHMEACFGPWTQNGLAEQESSGSAGGQQTDSLGALPENLPPVLRDALPELLQKLGLGPHASLEDVLCRLRGQKGILSELETSLLFLDAWSKQYKK